LLRRGFHIAFITPDPGNGLFLAEAVVHFSGFARGVASPGIRPIDHCTISSHIF
jgi:hypothetical protein